MIVTSIFPAVIKLTDIIGNSKKGSKTSKENFKSVSILSNVSKN